MAIPAFTWPLRERWAEARQRNKYPDCDVRHDLSNFLSSVEITALGVDLEKLYAACGDLLPRAKVALARRRITSLLQQLRTNAVPFAMSDDAAPIVKLLAPIRRRRDDAYKLAREAWAQHSDNPVDDEAWAAELQRRATIEATFAIAWAAPEEAETPVDPVAA